MTLKMREASVNFGFDACRWILFTSTGGSGHQIILERGSHTFVSIRHRACGIRESRVRGGAATRPSLAAVAVCGGVQKRNLATRAGREAWADKLGLTVLSHTCRSLHLAICIYDHGPEKKKMTQFTVHSSSGSIGQSHNRWSRGNLRGRRILA